MPNPSGTGIKWTALLDSQVELAKKEVAREIFDEIVCPMCYRLNPHHATMDNGEGCHWCQEKEDWCGEPEERKK